MVMSPIRISNGCQEKKKLMLFPATYVFRLRTNRRESWEGRFQVKIRKKLYRLPVSCPLLAMFKKVGPLIL